MRETAQRATIREVFEETQRPLTAGEVADLARERGAPVGIATVYRNLRRLSESGWLKRVDLPGAEAHFERAGRGHHHHFRCLVCRRVYEVEGCPGDLGTLTPDGFRLRGHEIVLYGECDECVPGLGKKA